MKGTISKILPQGFGFIAREGQEKDIFFHNTALVGVTIEQLQVGDAVTYEEAQSDKGMNAVNVQRA